MGYFFGMCPSLVSNTAGKFPLFTSMILRKFGWFFEAFLGQDVQLVFFGSWENDDKILDVVRCPFE